MFNTTMLIGMNKDSYGNAVIELTPAGTEAMVNEYYNVESSYNTCEYSNPEGWEAAQREQDKDAAESNREFLSSVLLHEGRVAFEALSEEEITVIAKASWDFNFLNR